MAICIVSEKSKTRQFYFLHVQVRISNPSWSCWASSRAGSSLSCWMKRSCCQRLPSCSKVPNLRLCKMRVCKAKADGPSTRPCTCPRAGFTLSFSSRDMVQHQVGGITQHCFLPRCQKSNFEAWSRYYLNSKLPFEDVLVIFNQIAEAIHSKIHGTFKSNFLP